MEEVKSDDEVGSEHSDGDKESATRGHWGGHEMTEAAPDLKLGKDNSEDDIRTSNHNDLLERALAYSRAGTSVATGTKVSRTSTACAGNGHGHGGCGSGADNEGAEIRATAAALLRRLLVDKQEILRPHFHKIPFMPQARITSSSAVERSRTACRIS